MLAPQFSLRQMLAMMTGLGVFSLIASLAVRGHVWAASLVIAGCTLVLVFLLLGLCFFSAWCVSLVTRPAARKPGLPSASDPKPRPEQDTRTEEPPS